MTRYPWIRIVRERTECYRPDRACGTPCGVATAVLEHVGDAITESIYVVCLDARMRPIAVCEVARGGVDSAVVTMADIFRPAIAVGARAIVLAHNHPSGDPTPSELDDRMTATVRKAGELLGLPLLDHVIIASGDHYSYSTEGQL